MNRTAFCRRSKGSRWCRKAGPGAKNASACGCEKRREAAKEGSFDFFTTTLTVSPLKNAPLLNQIGEEMAAKYGVRWLPSDFKKKEGYKRSITLSHQYGLYRQDYCGCAFSKRERMEEKRRREQEGAETMTIQSIGGALHRSFKKETVLCLSFLAAVLSAFFVPPDSGYLDYLDTRVLILLFLPDGGGERPAGSRHLGPAFLRFSCGGRLPPGGWGYCLSCCAFLPLCC